MKRIAVLAALACAAPLASASAETCPEEDGQLLLHACQGPFAAEALLLPEDAGALGASDAPRLLVTGVYTSAERRDGDLPLPVGLFVRRGELVNRQYAPVDGVLLIGRDGALSLHHRRRVRLGLRRYDLDDAEARDRFLHAAEAVGGSVMQSHLLIVDGRVDVSPDDDAAPRFRRRLLFVDGEGRAGLWQSAGSVTLHDAAAELLAAHGAVMALNLDMGSFDFCVLQPAGAEPGEGTRCGLIGWDDAAKLSNLLVFDLSRR